MSDKAPPAVKGNGQRRTTMLVDRAYQLQELYHGVNQFILLIFLEMVLFCGIAYMLRYDILDEAGATMAFVGVAFAVPVLLSITYSLSVIRRTHRVAGAAYRLSVDLKNIITDPSFRFHLRKDDYLQQLAGELNGMMDQIEARQTAVQEAAEILLKIREGLGPVCGTLDQEDAKALRQQLDRIDNALQTARFGPTSSASQERSDKKEGDGSSAPTSPVPAEV